MASLSSSICISTVLPRAAEQGAKGAIAPPKIALWGSALRTMCYLRQCASPSASPNLILLPPPLSASTEMEDIVSEACRVPAVMCAVLPIQ